jgi:adenosylcobinamide-phosphate synthase
MSFSLILALSALSLEALIGYPAPLFARIGHPVTWIGALISWLEKKLNREVLAAELRRRNGFVALGVVLIVSGGLALALMLFLPGVWGFLILVVIAASLPAQRSLYDHVARVAEALETQGLDAGRTAVSMIVGRDVAVLDEAGVSRAAIESLAENFSDGVVAPGLYLAALGLPGGVLLKAINTADSMIGHRTARYEAFGFASAKLDDVVMWVPARLSVLLIAGASLALPGASALAALKAAWRDARGHRSPNAGWPEAALAGALGFQLSGPRLYHGVEVQDAFMGEGRRELNAADIRKSLKLYRNACLIQIALYAGLLLIALG